MTNHNGSRPRPRSAAGLSTPNGGRTRSLPQTRWIDWVRALAARWGRGSARNDRLALTLLRPLTVARELRQRWLVKSQRFYPKINLSVQVFLRATGPTVTARGTSRDGVVVDRRFQATDQLYVVTGNERFDSRERGIRPALASSAESLASRAAEHEPGMPGRIEVMSPLERVLARSESLIETREAAGTVRVETILRRLTVRSERIESRFSTSAMPATRFVSAQSKIPSFAGERAEAPARFPRVDALSQQHLDREPGSAQDRRLGVESAINIEQITDRVIRQLDRRVVAARERMGKTF